MHKRVGYARLGLAMGAILLDPDTLQLSVSVSGVASWTMATECGVSVASRFESHTGGIFFDLRFIVSYPI